MDQNVQDIVDNHQQIDQLSDLLKHHSINAAFVTACVIDQLAQSEEDFEEEVLNDLHSLFESFQ